MGHWRYATLAKIKQNFQIRKISDCTPVLNISSSSQALNESTYDTEPAIVKKVRKPKKKTLKSDFPPWLKEQNKLKEIRCVSSFVYNQGEAACVTMTDQFYITDVRLVSFKKVSIRKCSQYLDIVNPLLCNLPKSDLHLLENNQFPYNFVRTNLHLRSLTMLLMGSLQTPNGDPKVVLLDRMKVGRVFNLMIEKTRINSEKLVYEIVKHRRWNDHDIIYSPEMIRTTVDEKVLFQQQDLDDSDEITPQEQLMTPSVGDAILQGIAFWEVTKNLR